MCSAKQVLRWCCNPKCLMQFLFIVRICSDLVSESYNCSRSCLFQPLLWGCPFLFFMKHRTEQNVKGRPGVQWWELSHWVTGSRVRSSLSADFAVVRLALVFPFSSPHSCESLWHWVCPLRNRMWCPYLCSFGSYYKGILCWDHVSAGIVWFWILECHCHALLDVWIRPGLLGHHSPSRTFQNSDSIVMPCACVITSHGSAQHIYAQGPLPSLHVVFGEVFLSIPL